MATASIVSMLLEGGGTIGNLALDMPQYTLESGAALIARESSNELHEIFELAIVETNEAALGAYMEGSSDVMESATYGPVFEEAENKSGNKVIEFLRNLKNKVLAFFRNILDRIVMAFNNYEKFYKKNEAALKKAEPLKDCPCVKWKNDNIESIAKNIKTATADISKFESKACENLKKMIEADIKGTKAGIPGINRHDKDEDYAKKAKKEANATVNAIMTTLGFSAPKNGTAYDATALHNKAVELFRDGKEPVKKTVTVKDVESVLTSTKKAAGDIKTAQKEFNSAYDTAIKNVKAVKEMMEKSQRKGLMPHLNSVVSTMSKAQTVINVYASTGYSALVARATESKKIANALISGKAPKSK